MVIIFLATLVALALSLTARLISRHRNALIAGKKPRLLKSTLSKLRIGPEYPIETRQPKLKGSYTGDYSVPDYGAIAPRPRKVKRGSDDLGPR